MGLHEAVQTIATPVEIDQPNLVDACDPSFVV
jgi:hypothetical protein